MPLPSGIRNFLRLMVLPSLIVLPMACRNPGEKPAADPGAASNFKGSEDAGAGTEAALARAGVSLADLPDLESALPTDALPPEDGLLPTSLPEYVEGMEDRLTDAQGEESPEAPGGWHRSGRSALRAARAQDRPLVIWFCNTQAGPLDNQLGSQVLQRPETQKVLSEKAVGLKIDFANDTTRKSSYYQSFRKRYKITGYPTLVFVQPDGAEASRQFGYSPSTAEARVQNFERAAVKAGEAWKNRKIELGKIGFCHWTDRDGRKFFAKALRRDARMAVLIDPYRQVFRVPLERFSHESLVDLLDGIPESPRTEE